MKQLRRRIYSCNFEAHGPCVYTPAKPLASYGEPAALVDSQGVEEEPSARLKIGVPLAPVVVTTVNVVDASLVVISHPFLLRMLNKLLPKLVLQIVHI